MKFIAEIDVMPHKELLDPQGKTVAKSMKHINIQGVEDVRIGKHIRLLVDAEDEADASAIVDAACRKILINPIMENFSFALHSA